MIRYQISFKNKLCKNFLENRSRNVQDNWRTHGPNITTEITSKTSPIPTIPHSKQCPERKKHGNNL